MVNIAMPKIVAPVKALGVEVCGGTAKPLASRKASGRRRRRGPGSRLRAGAPRGRRAGARPRAGRSRSRLRPSAATGRSARPGPARRRGRRPLACYSAPRPGGCARPRRPGRATISRRLLAPAPSKSLTPVAVSTSIPRERVQVRRAALLDQPALGDDRHPVADQLDLAQQVRVEQNGDVAAAQLFEQVAHDPPAHRVQRAGRLVEQEQARRSEQRLGDAEPLLHPLGHRLHPRAGGVAPARPARAARRAPLAPPGEPQSRWGSPSSLVGRAPTGEAEQLGEVPDRGARLGASRRAGRTPRCCRRSGAPGRRRSWSGSTFRPRWARAGQAAPRRRARDRRRPVLPCRRRTYAGRGGKDRRHQAGASIFGKSGGTRSTSGRRGGSRARPARASPRRAPRAAVSLVCGR